MLNNAASSSSYIQHYQRLYSQHANELRCQPFALEIAVVLLRACVRVIVDLMLTLHMIAPKRDM
jgi:hypothetical protein